MSNVEGTTVPSPSPNVVVSNGPNAPGGAFKTINEAVMRAPADDSPFVIYVMAGTYEEYVTITRSNVTMLGDGIGRTIITGKKSVHDSPGLSTSDTATLIVEGEGFIGWGITVQNTAGTGNDQAVAMRASANHAALYKCSFEGFQDTLYPESGNQFYRECHIYGTIDFIFSQTGRVVFQDCDIYVRDPRPKTTTTITADGRDVPDDINGGGICIHRCRVLATPELLQAMAAAKPHSTIHNYLGRPWKDYSRTVFMNTYMDGFLDPAGWTEWPGAKPGRYHTLYYAEYNSSGDGAPSELNKRVGWKGYHLLTNEAEVSQFTVARFIDGNSWLPKTRVPFSPGLDPGQSPLI